jgi:hypothetical protein
MTLTNAVKTRVVFLYMLVSIASIASIPILRPWGADLHNLQIFHECARGRSPYDISGPACGDLWRRPMIYPPLMYHSFGWTRGLTLERAMHIWITITFVGFAAILVLWTRGIARERRSDSDWEIWLFIGLLLFQYPFVFTMERGGTDIGAVLGWTLAAYFFTKRWITAAGAMAGLAVAYKLYPIFPCVVISIALLVAAFRSKEFGRLDFLKFGGASAATFIGSNLLFYSEAKPYFTRVLPEFADSLGHGGGVFTHSIPTFVGADYRLFARLLGMLVVVPWIWASPRALAKRGDLVMAGVLAMSTFMAGTSWDYNLVTMYPLFVVLFVRARKTGRFALLGLGLLAVIGERNLFNAPDARFLTPAVHLMLQIAFVIGAAITAAVDSDELETKPAAPAVST